MSSLFKRIAHQPEKNLYQFYGVAQILSELIGGLPPFCYCLSSDSRPRTSEQYLPTIARIYRKYEACIGQPDFGLRRKEWFEELTTDSDRIEASVRSFPVVAPRYLSAYRSKESACM